MNISLGQLKKIIPYAGSKAGVFLGPLNEAMVEFSIDTPARQAAFLAQVAHESGSFRYPAEIAGGSAYEGRADLGNTEPGDGCRFKGRGLIQITGRANYASCSTALYGDPKVLLAHPEMLEGVIPACRSAGWFWWAHGLNKWADAGDFDGLSDVINRGHKTKAIGDANGYAERLAFFNIAKKVIV